MAKNASSKIALGSPVVEVAWDPRSENYLLVAQKDGKISLYDTEAKEAKEVSVFARHSGGLRALAWVPEIPGGFVTVSERNGVIRMWNVSQVHGSSHHDRQAPPSPAGQGGGGGRSRKSARACMCGCDARGACQEALGTWGVLRIRRFRVFKNRSAWLPRQPMWDAYPGVHAQRAPPSSDDGATLREA